MHVTGSRKKISLGIHHHSTPSKYPALHWFPFSVCDGVNVDRLFLINFLVQASLPCVAWACAFGATRSVVTCKVAVRPPSEGSSSSTRRSYLRSYYAMTTTDFSRSFGERRPAQGLRSNVRLVLDNVS